MKPLVHCTFLPLVVLDLRLNLGRDLGVSGKLLFHSDLGPILGVLEGIELSLELDHARLGGGGEPLSSGIAVANLASISDEKESSIAGTLSFENAASNSSTTPGVLMVAFHLAQSIDLGAETPTTAFWISAWVERRAWSSARPASEVTL